MKSDKRKQLRFLFFCVFKAAQSLRDYCGNEFFNRWLVHAITSAIKISQLRRGICRIAKKAIDFFLNSTEPKNTASAQLNILGG